MITKQLLIDIVNNPICTICKNGIIPEYDGYFNCKFCNIFYGGKILLTNKLDIYIGYKYYDNVFVFNQVEHELKLYFTNIGNIEKSKNINFFADKIPESIEELDNLYKQIQKIQVFK